MNGSGFLGCSAKPINSESGGNRCAVGFGFLPRFPSNAFRPTVFIPATVDACQTPGIVVPGNQLDHDNSVRFFSNLRHGRDHALGRARTRRRYLRQHHGPVPSGRKGQRYAILPMLSVGKTKSARMWVYVGDEANAYNVFDFTLNRGRDGPKYFLQDYEQVLLADAYGGYNGVVAGNQITRAGCWSHARRKFIDAEKVAPRLHGKQWSGWAFSLRVERQAKDFSVEERLALRQAQSAPVGALDPSAPTLLADGTQVRCTRKKAVHSAGHAGGTKLSLQAMLLLIAFSIALPLRAFAGDEITSLHVCNKGNVHIDAISVSKANGYRWFVLGWLPIPPTNAITCSPSRATIWTLHITSYFAS